MSRLHIQRPSALFALIAVFIVTTVSDQGGVTAAAPIQELDAWCKNLTTHLTRTWMEFKNVDFNRTTTFVKDPSSGVTEFQRLGYDMRDLKNQALLFPQLHPNVTIYGGQVVQCVQINTVMYAGLVATMEMTELYLDGTVPSLPQLQGSQMSPAVNKIRYQAIGREIAQLKNLMRSAISIIKDMHMETSEDSTA